MGVMALVAPGPDVTINTPGLPEMRAYLRVRALRPSQSPCQSGSARCRSTLGRVLPDAQTTHAKVHVPFRHVPTSLLMSWQAKVEVCAVVDCIKHWENRPACRSESGKVCLSISQGVSLTQPFTPPLRSRSPTTAPVTDRTHGTNGEIHSPPCPRHRTCAKEREGCGGRECRAKIQETVESSRAQI